MDTGKILTPEESLSLIAETISKSRDSIRENSFGFLLWGWLVSSASFASFLLQLLTNFKYHFIPFPIVGTVGIAITLVLFKRRNAENTQTYTAYFINKMWLVLGLCFILAVFINVSQGRVPFTFTLLIAGCGTLISGWVMKFRPLILGGFLLMVSAVASIYLTDEYKTLLHGIAIVPGYLIPGYLLKNAKA
ncbi:hypothetical protein [Dyadobacter arcticus]|uniref:Magnesium-transporting ATPase (P-type) n=1 Tax=Dyadobacter arcticus TaxID=1078754 RepID=A0ABX0UJS5_9BACT|nr:hypothetical protein [Dyadobacter arcticus]NIJ52738.1 magnesium-transporting ATPase (P-type) [Dyadobacter arcticus]